MRSSNRWSILLVTPDRWKVMSNTSSLKYPLVASCRAFMPIPVVIFESMLFLFPFGGIGDRSLQGMCKKRKDTRRHFFSSSRSRAMDLSSSARRALARKGHKIPSRRHFVRLVCKKESNEETNRKEFLFTYIWYSTIQFNRFQEWLLYPCWPTSTMAWVFHNFTLEKFASDLWACRLQQMPCFK